MTPAEQLQAAATKLRDAEAQGMTSITEVMHPGVGAALVAVFTAWARMGEMDPDLLHRVGGRETLAVARAILGEPS